MSKYRLEFTIQGLPKTTNASSRHGHWSMRKKEADKWKRQVQAKVLVSEAGRPIEPLKKAKLTLTRCSSMEPDFDGMVSAFKSVIDGLVVAGILENDKMSNIGIPTYIWEKAKQRQGCIRIIVESCDH